MKGFTNKPLINQSYTSIKPKKRHIITNIIMIIGIFGLIVTGVWGSQNIMPRIQSQLTSAVKSSIGAVGSTIGTEVETDEMGQLSVLLVGVGGEGHRGTYNTDTMMVASYNPKTKAVTFLSLPRDLYVNIDTNRNGRINAVLNAQINDGKSLTGALQALTTKVSSIVGVQIDHYVLVDFKGFEKMIDTLGGIQVNVPKTIIDPTYPADEFRTMTLTINSGSQTMNGDLALKYARSRHSTSDFDRALRQQQIIQGVIKQLLGGGGILKLNELRNDFNEAIITDFDFTQLLGLAKYLNRIEHYFSFVLQSGCDEYYKLTKPGCLLYSPDRSAFGGASILLPLGASAGRISYYDKIQKFAYYVIYQQAFLTEKARIVLWNGIDKKQLLPGQNPNGIMSDIASDLVTYGFNIVGIGNNNNKSTSSTIITLGTGTYDTTLNILKDFAPATTSTIVPTALSGTIFSGSNEVSLDTSGVDLIVVIGNDYLATKATKQKKQ